MKVITSIIQRLPNPKPSWAWVAGALAIGAVTLSVILSGLFAQDFQDWLIGSGSSRESGSETIRNVGLVIAGLVALYLAIWRGLAAQQQASAAHQALRNERYQKGAEMLGHDSLSVRLGGIYALQRLSNEYPDEYHVQILRLLCAFARHPTSDEKHVQEVTAKFDLPQIREDVQAIVRIVGNRGSERVNLERIENYHPNLQHAYMSFSELGGTNLENTDISHADLLCATLKKSNLSNVVGIEVNLEDAALSQATLSGAMITWANCTNADLTRADLSLALLREQTCKAHAYRELICPVSPV